MSSSVPDVQLGKPSREPLPCLSVVVVSFNRLSLLVQCLEALLAQADDADVIVIRDCHPSQRASFDALKARLDHVRWFEAPLNCTVPRMRSLGICQARGDIVALLEDDCMVAPGWYDAVRAAHRGPHIAVGGAVEPGPYRRGLDWGVYFADYGRFMLPLSEGRGAVFPGNNTSYKQAALAALPVAATQEFHEVFVHWAWQRAQLPMRADPAVRVRNMHRWTIADVTRIPYHHGRAFAAQRFAHQPVWRRLLFSMCAPLLPALKVARIVRDTMSRRRLIGRLCQALPWTLVYTTSWSIGESIGALWGPGDSPSAWR